MASLKELAEIQRVQELEWRAREFPRTKLDDKIDDLKEDLSWSTRAFNVDGALKAMTDLEAAHTEIPEDVKRYAVPGARRLAITIETVRKQRIIDRAMWDSLLILASESISRGDVAVAQKIADVAWEARFPQNPKESDRVAEDLMKLTDFLEGAEEKGTVVF